MTERINAYDALLDARRLAELARQSRYPNGGVRHASAQELMMADAIERLAAVQEQLLDLLLAGLTREGRGPVVEVDVPASRWL